MLKKSISFITIISVMMLPIASQASDPLPDCEADDIEICEDSFLVGIGDGIDNLLGGLTDFGERARSNCYKGRKCKPPEEPPEESYYQLYGQFEDYNNNFDAFLLGTYDDLTGGGNMSTMQSSTCLAFSGC